MKPLELTINSDEIKDCHIRLVPNMNSIRKKDSTKHSIRNFLGSVNQDLKIKGNFEEEISGKWKYKGEFKLSYENYENQKRRYHIREVELLLKSENEEIEIHGYFSNIYNEAVKGYIKNKSKKLFDKNKEIKLKNIDIKASV